jgi:preprotein translocase subunit SecG
MFQIFFIAVSILFIIAVLLQQKNSGLGSMVGGGAGEELAQTRRGADKFLHNATIVLATLFFGGGIYSMFFL